MLLEQFSRLCRTPLCQRVEQLSHLSPSVPTCSGVARSAEGLVLVLSAAFANPSVGGGCGSTASPRTGALTEGGSDAAAVNQHCSSACGEQQAALRVRGAAYSWACSRPAGQGHRHLWAGSVEHQASGSKTFWAACERTAAAYLGTSLPGGHLCPVRESVG